MSDRNRWSVSLGRWGGCVDVRLHLFFLVFTAFTCYFCSQAGLALTEVAALSIGILLVSVMLHELGHYQAAVRLDADPHQRLVIGPFGGLEPIAPPPRDPWAELWIRLAGPAVSVVLCAIALLLLAVDTSVNILEMLNPLQPLRLIEPTSMWLTALRLMFWINWSLFVINLLPAAPFDGGAALRAWIVAVHPDRSRIAAANWVAFSGKLASLGLALCAVMFYRSADAALVPSWLPLILLALFLYFSAKQEEQSLDSAEEDAELFAPTPWLEPQPYRAGERQLDLDLTDGYDSSDYRPSEFSSSDYGSSELCASGSDDSSDSGSSDDSFSKEAVESATFDAWFDGRRREWDQQQQVQEDAEDDRRLDAILERVHREGYASLDDESRALLERVSQRYRSRRPGV